MLSLWCCCKTVCVWEDCKCTGWGGTEGLNGREEGWKDRTDYECDCVCVRVHMYVCVYERTSLSKMSVSFYFVLCHWYFCHISSLFMTFRK